MIIFNEHEVIWSLTQLDKFHLPRAAADRLLFCPALIIQAATLSLLHCTLLCQPFTAVEASGPLAQLLFLK